MRAKFVKLLAIEHEGWVELIDPSGFRVAKSRNLVAYKPSHCSSAGDEARRVLGYRRWSRWAMKEQGRINGEQFSCFHNRTEKTMRDRCDGIASSLRTRTRAAINGIIRGELGVSDAQYLGKHRSSTTWKAATRSMAASVARRDRESNPWKKWSDNRAANIRKRHRSKEENANQARDRRRRNARADRAV